MTARRSDWEQRLADCIIAHRERPYELGRHDCLTFAAAAVKAVTGKDHARGHRGKYRTQLEAARYLKSLGFDSAEAMIDSILEEMPIGYAGRGDIVLASDGIPAVGMIGFALSVGTAGDQEGLVSIPRSDWVKAWRVGS